MADSRVVGSSSGSAPPSGVPRTTGQSTTTNNTSSTEVGKKTEDTLPLGAIDPVALKARTQANLAQYFNAVSTPAAPTNTQPPQNPMAMLAGFIGPGITALTSALGSLKNNSGNGAPQISPNPQELAQNTPRDPKDPKTPKDPKDPKKEDAIVPPKEPTPKPPENKPIGQRQDFDTENIG